MMNQNRASIKLIIQIILVLISQSLVKIFKIYKKNKNKGFYKDQALQKPKIKLIVMLIIRLARFTPIRLKAIKVTKVNI